MIEQSGKTNSLVRSGLKSYFVYIYEEYGFTRDVFLPCYAIRAHGSI